MIKDYKFWFPIAITIVVNVIGIVWMTAVFKTSVEGHIKDTSVHIDPKKEYTLNEQQKDMVVSLTNLDPKLSRSDINNRLLKVELWQNNFDKNMDILIEKAIKEYLKQKEQKTK